LPTKFVEKIKTHFLCSITFFENLAVREITCKDILEPDRPHIAIRRMSNARWIPKSTKTRLEYVILIAFSL